MGVRRKHGARRLFRLTALLIAFGLPSAASLAQTLPVVGVTQIRAPVNDNGLFTRVNTKANNFETMLQTQLIQTNRFRVIERSRVDEILGEQGLNNSFGDGVTASGGFNVEGVDYLIYGAVTKFGQTEKVMGTGNFAQVTLTTEFEADIKVVEASTGAIRKAEVASVKLQTAGGIATGNFVTADAVGDPLSDAQRIAAKKVAAIIATSIFPVEVLRVDGAGVIYLNYGKAILSEGDKIEIYRPGEALVDEATGLNLGSEEELIASARITSVSDQFSKAKLLRGVAPARGDQARISRNASESNPMNGKPATEKRGRTI